MSKSYQYENQPDPRPELVVEEGVGSWVPEKHTYLGKYISATYAARSRFPHRVYVDLFCGPGRVQVRNELITRDGGAMVAWNESRQRSGAFTQLLIGDLDFTKLRACESRLLASGAPVQAFHGGAQDVVESVAAKIQSSALVLVYLDPYNLGNLSFRVIERLARFKAVDFALHYSTMDLQRNVEMDFQSDHPRFDAAAPGWRQHINIKTLSKTECRSAFFQYWCSLVQQLGFKVSDRLPIVRDDRQNPLYRMVFLSRHELPDRIWGDCAQGPNRELF